MFPSPTRVFIRGVTVAARYYRTSRFKGAMVGVVPLEFTFARKDANANRQDAAYLTPIE